MKSVMENNLDSVKAGVSGKRKYSSSKMSYLDVTVNSPILGGSVVTAKTKIRTTSQEVTSVDMSQSSFFNVSWEDATEF